MSAGNTPRRAQQRMPDFVRDALNQAGLMSIYQARPLYQQNDYLDWILDGNLEQTKEKRLSQMLDELKHGKLYMTMAWTPRTKRNIPKREA